MRPSRSERKNKVVTTLNFHSSIDPEALVALGGAFTQEHSSVKKPVKEQMSFRYFEKPRGGHDTTTAEYVVTLQPGQTEVLHPKSVAGHVTLYCVSVQRCGSDEANPVYHDMDVDLGDPDKVKLLRRVSPSRKGWGLQAPARLN